MRLLVTLRYNTNNGGEHRVREAQGLSTLMLIPLAFLLLFVFIPLERIYDPGGYTPDADDGTCGDRQGATENITYLKRTFRMDSCIEQAKSQSMKPATYT
jgi:hypothetical protein